MPLLIVAELVVHRRMRPMVRQFLERGLIPDAARPTFDAAIASAMRLRNSIWAEVLLIALVYVVGVGVRLADADRARRGQLARRAGRWEMAADAGRLVAGLREPAAVPVPAAALVFPAVHLGAVPVAGVAHRVAARCRRIRTAAAAWAFWLGVSLRVLAAVAGPGVVLAGMMANRIFYAGAKLPEFKVELIGLVAVMVFAVLGPLLVFSLQLEAAKRAGLREYGTLAQRYVREYDRQMAARRGAAGRAAGRQRRHPVPGGPRQQLRSGEGDEVGAVHACRPCCSWR